MSLKKSDYDGFKLTRKEIVTEENYHVISRVRGGKEQIGMKQTYCFFSAMWKQEKPYSYLFEEAKKAGPVKKY